MKETKKNKGGRPSPFESLKRVMRELYLHGKTDKEVADLLNIDESTITKWKQKNSEFFTSLKDWKAEADEKVVKSLYERACGYEHPEDKIFVSEGIPIIVPTTKKYPPDPTSMIFWLKNRQPDKWRDKQEIEQTKPFEIVITDYRGKETK